MARRVTLEGAVVPAVFELMPYSGGLKRNIAQCLDDYGIPLYLSHTVTAVKGRDRVEGVWVSQVGPDLKPIPGTEKLWECDTLLLSVGLIPENELSRAAGIETDPRNGGLVVYENRETSIPGIFAAGNVVHVHDLADFASAEASIAGRAAACFRSAQNGFKGSGGINTPDDPQKRAQRSLKGLLVDVVAGEGVAYTVPQKIRPENIDGQINIPGLNIDKKCDIFFRVRSMFDNGVIEINSEAGTLKFERGHLPPGEMVRLSLPKSYLEKSSSVKISVKEQLGR